jgi:hypothetical protein
MMPVDRRGRKYHIRALAKALLPEHHGYLPTFSPLRFPDAPSANQRGRLLPEHNPAQISIKQSIPHHPMRGRRTGGTERSLDGARQCREDPARGTEVPQPGYAERTPADQIMSERRRLNHQQLLPFIAHETAYRLLSVTG